MQTFATRTKAAQRSWQAGSTRPAAPMPRVRAVLHGPRVQAKLKVGAVNDPAEAEADRVADQVMRMAEPQAPDGANSPAVMANVGARPIRRMCVECEEEARRKPAEETVRRAQEDEDELIRSKETPGASPTLTAGSESAITGLRGGGSPLSASERAFFEPRFGHGFENVHVHYGAAADAAARSIDARAFTLGYDIAFASNEYNPGATEHRALLAHELTHVVQQEGSTPLLQRAWLADTGWRYTPPATVRRSIEEIQAIVGITPDGVYGVNTREAVKRYQTQLTSMGLYSGTVDGKWGGDTELGHVAYATGSETETYNCSGLAFKKYIHIDMPDTEVILSRMTQLSSCSDNCGPRQYKFWHWSYDVSLTDLGTGATGPSHRDFHIVGGQTDGSGNDPSVVVSKNGRRPVEGPAAPASWRPVTELARENNHLNRVVPGIQKNRTNHVERCFCAASLP